MIFLDCQECVTGMKNEVDSEGRKYTTKSISGKLEERECREIVGYNCTLAAWDDREDVLKYLGEENYEFLKVEFSEWIDPEAGNPGHAWEKDRKTWEPFLKDSGQFSYTYNHRFWLKNQETSEKLQVKGQLENAMEALMNDPFSRQAYVGIWSPYIDSKNILRSGPDGRVPCTIGYHFMIRPWRDEEYHLEMVYSMRSLCVSWNLWNDLWLVTNLFDYFREELCNRGFNIDGKKLVEDGYIHIHAGSLHSFK